MLFQSRTRLAFCAIFSILRDMFLGLLGVMMITCETKAKTERQTEISDPVQTDLASQWETFVWL